jgi:hypothetical protein
MSKPTLELRWFFKDLVPAEVRQWFVQKLPADQPRKEKSRTDLYFIVRERDDLGLKLSRGRLELKWRRQAEPFSLSEPRVAGVAETWIKEEWRFDKEYTNYLDLAFGKPKLKGWRVEVHKNRSMLKYQVDSQGHAADLATDDTVPRLLKVELTDLIKHDRPWWTLGLEISGEPQNLPEIFALALKNLLQDLPRLDLQTSCSFGYPHWLVHSL